MEVPSAFVDAWKKFDPFFEPEHASKSGFGVGGRHLIYLVPKLAPIVYFEEQSDGVLKRLYAGSVATVDMAVYDGAPVSGGVWLQSYLSGGMTRKVPLSAGTMLEGYINADDFFPVFDSAKHYENVTSDGLKMGKRLESLGVSCIDTHTTVFEMGKLGKNMDTYNKLIRAKNKTVSKPLVDMFPWVAYVSGETIMKTAAEQ
jgi:hypothetical protein